MENRKIDRLFRDKLITTKVEVDVDDVWNNINRKKKRRLFVIICFMGILISSFICGLFYFTNIKNEITASQNFEVANNAELNILKGCDEEDDKGLVVISKLEGNSYVNSIQSKINDDAGIFNKSQINTSAYIDNRLMELQDEFIPLTINTKEADIASKIYFNTSELSSSDLSSESSNHIFLNSDLLDRVKLEYLFNKSIILPLLFVEPNFMIADNKSFELDFSSGIGPFRSNLIGDQDYVNSRLNNEKDRYTTIVSMELFYWVKRRFGLSIDGSFQKHYSYFENIYSRKIYEVNRYKTSYYISSRNIKSNIIISQLHMAGLFNYKFSKSNFSFILSAGPSYNLKTSGSGKFLNFDELSDYNESDNLIQTSGLGIVGKFKLKYSTSKRSAVHIGVNYHRQNGDILINEFLEQKVNSIYFSTGLSYSF